MPMSCNGCRVLRKGCSDDCSLRPCLDWIQNPDSQGNATVFLAKFYGRTGLMNLINAGPQHLRPAIFRSLLYEACGRIVNPIQGSVGLVWSGGWHLCQNAVDAVLSGSPITQIVTTENSNVGDGIIPESTDLLRARTCRFKRSAKLRQRRARVNNPGREEVNNKRSPSHESSLSQAVEPNVEKESANLASAEPALGLAKEVELDLTLGFEPFKGCVKPKALAPVKGADGSADQDEAELCKMELGLDYPVGFV
ncbi:LOB domain-containing protein 41 [Phtheirospermum japonicum]|uniref:LOB domain-containing protein 41 n=1 Tax=Phtheirospermum japonicum TaxID=374723 RepID=A0A830CQW2_9LAMI|nr:LOB domain-containing protein 41 [Phtheirospermum japonicum]